MKDRDTMVILSPGFPADEQDHNCMPFPQSFVRKLKALNPSLEIIVLAFQYPFTETAYEWHGVKVYPFNGRNRGRLQRMFVWKNVWKKLGDIMKKQQVIGILDFWLGECALLGKFASKKYQIKNFTWLFGQDAKKNNRYHFLVKPAGETLIALSDFVADEYNRNYGQRPAFTIPAGIDKMMFSESTVSRYIDIMGAGSLIPLKRYDIFIKTIAQLVKTNKQLNVVLCGEGEERDSLVSLIRENNLEQHINLVGEVPHAQVLLLMQSTKLFLHPSAYEGFSTVCAEALYAGAHVVSFCKPMASSFPHHHIVSSETDLVPKLESLLDTEMLDHQPVQTYPIETTCDQILHLYKTPG